MREYLLYVHVPFCSSKCLFCSYVVPVPVHALVKSKDRYEDYVEAVIRQIRFMSEKLGGKSCGTRLIYFGGGTPSVLSGEQLARIFLELKSAFGTGANYRDASIEMSPETATAEKLQRLQEAGVSRISLGVQSFDDDRLKRIARSHDSKEAERAFERARKAGFDSVNLDLIVGFPEETREEWTASFNRALALQPDHVSVYTYRKMPGTVMSNLLDQHQLEGTSKDEIEHRYSEARERLVGLGYEEYMFQLFGKRDHRCHSDLTYFGLECDHVGFGAGAHSLISKRAIGHWSNSENYLKDPVKPSYNYPIRQVESVMVGKFIETLHTEQGMNYARFESRLGISLSDACEAFPKLREFHDSVRSSDLLEETDAGFRFRSSEHRSAWLIRAR